MIHDDKAGPYNSFGNGSAMRVSPVAWFERHDHRVMFIAEKSAEVTHNHPEGIKGAQATAMVILWARNGVPRNRIRRDLEAQFGYDTSTSVEELQKTYEYNETCQRTVPEAFRCFYEASVFLRSHGVRGRDPQCDQHWGRFGYGCSDHRKYGRGKVGCAGGD